MAILPILPVDLASKCNYKFDYYFIMQRSCKKYLSFMNSLCKSQHIFNSKYEKYERTFSLITSIQIYSFFSDNNFGGNVDNRKFMNEGVQSSGYEYPETTRSANGEPGKGSSSSGRNSPPSSSKHNLV